MLQMVLDGAFDQLAKQLTPTIKSQIESFTRDYALMRSEDRDSLINIAYQKLWQALQDFVYEEGLTEKHNELRFISFFRTYVKNALIDMQYKANMPKRCAAGEVWPVGNVVYEAEDGAGIDVSEDNDFTVDPVDKTPDCVELAAYADLVETVLRHLQNDEKTIFKRFAEGYEIESIAARTGIAIARIRQVLANRIRPLVERYGKCSR